MQPQVPVHVRALVLLGLHGVKELLTSASAISVFARLSDKSVKLVLQTTLAVLPAITRQPGFLWFVVKDSCVERLFVCASALSLIMMSSHWCAPPSRSSKTRATRPCSSPRRPRPAAQVQRARRLGDYRTRTVARRTRRRSHGRCWPTGRARARTNQITLALVAYRLAADQGTATASIAQVDGLLAGKLGPRPCK